MAPRRFTGDYANKAYNLENAIEHALERHADDVEQQRVALKQPEPERPHTSPSKPRSRKTTRDADADDELATAAFPPPSRDAPTTSSIPDDLRSFGMESDVYGDATIASTPSVAAPGSIQRPGQGSVNRRDARRRSNKAIQDPAYRDEGSEESSDDELGLRRSRRRPRKSTAKSAEQQSEEQIETVTASSNLTNGYTRAPSRTEPRKQTTTRSQSPRSLARYAQVQQIEAEKREELARQEAEAEERQRLARETADAERRHQKAEAERRQQLAQQKAEAEAERRRQKAQQKAEAERRQQVARQQAEAEAEAEAEAAAARVRAAEVSDSDIASNHSEQDATLQQQIQDREDALAEERYREVEGQRWQQRWDKLQSLSPHKYLQRRLRQVPEPEDEDEDEEAQDTTGSIWYTIFSVRTYVDAVSRFWTWVWQTLTSLFSTIYHYLPSLFGTAALLGAALLVAALATSNIGHADDLFETSRPSIYNPIAALKTISGNLGSMVPNVAWPSRNKWDDIIDFTDFDSTGKLQVDTVLQRLGEQFELLKRAGLQQNEAINVLKKIVPKVVHMKLDNGKPVVSEEFWHALRELIQSDGTIFTIQDDGQLSKKQWKLVSSKILDDAGLDSKVSSSVDGAESRMEKKISSLWDTWVKENDGKLQAMLGDSVEKIRSLGTDDELNARIARIIKEQPKVNVPTDGVVVTRDEFLRHLKNEFATHRAEIKAEMTELRPQVEQMVRDTIESLGVTKGQGSHMTPEARAEITTLVRQSVSQALANANIEAFAKGKIHSNWDTTLKHQINFFSMGSGATVNAQHSSTTYDPYREGVVNRRLLEHGIPAAKRWDRNEALADWTEDGDKWCAASDVNTEGKPYGYMIAVQLGRPVIPQQIVVEHILPGATIDPDARPQDIEVYVQIEDPEVRERVRDFSATHIRPLEDNVVVAPLADDMVLVGRFQYVGAELHDGVYVHQLSPELKSLGAETTEVIVRAVNNYGSPDHTCFYRVRMYGLSNGEEIIAPGQKEGKSLWQRLVGE